MTKLRPTGGYVKKGKQTSEIHGYKDYTDLLPTMQQLRADDATYQQIADTLNTQGHTTRRGKSWNAVQVMRVLGRAN